MGLKMELGGVGVVEGRGKYSPMNRRKKAKLALKAGCCRPRGLPGLPIWLAVSVGFVT